VSDPTGESGESGQKQTAGQSVSTEMIDLAAARNAASQPRLIELSGHRPRYVSEDVVAAYEAHQRELFSFALASTRSPDVAEDLVQEAFTRLISAMAAGDRPNNVRAWLYRVLANLVTSRARRNVISLRWLPFLARPETTAGPEEEVLRGVVAGEIKKALDGLSDVERTALLLAARGLSGRDVAAALGKTEASTRTMMCRARLRLRRELSGESEP
jgi:RNA polymerase sigma-70 factor (ECF subfamily)